MDDEKKEIQQSSPPSPFTITISVIKQQLSINVQDNTTKQAYQSLFNGDSLKKGGFNDHQIQNLSTIQKLIQLAKAGRNGLKLEISIGKQQDINNNNNDDYAEGGVQGIDVTKSQDIAAPAAVSEHAVIKITKKDDLFGDKVFRLQLDKVARDESAVNKEMIEDIMKEMSVLKNGLNRIKDLEIKLEESEKRARGQEAKIEKLEKGLRDKEIKIQEIEQRLESKQAENEGLRERLEALEIRGEERERKIKKLEESVNAQRGKVNDLEQGMDGISRMGTNIKKLEKNTEAQERKIKDLGEKSKGLTGLNAKIIKLEKETNKLVEYKIKMEENEEEKKQDDKSKIHWAKYSTDIEEDHIKWNIVKQAPTLENMIKREKNNNKLRFGVAGLYKIIYRWSSEEDNNKGCRLARFWLNGNCVADSRNYHSNAAGQITEILNIKVDDYINCKCDFKKGTDPDLFAMIIERIGDSI